jgi:hypothetical protein
MISFDLKVLSSLSLPIEETSKFTNPSTPRAPVQMILVVGLLLVGLKAVKLLVCFEFQFQD